MSLWTGFIRWTRTLRDPIEAEMVNRVDIVETVDEVNKLNIIYKVDMIITDTFTLNLPCFPQLYLIIS